MGFDQLRMHNFVSNARAPVGADKNNGLSNEHILRFSGIFNISLIFAKNKSLIENLNLLLID